MGDWWIRGGKERLGAMVIDSLDGVVPIGNSLRSYDRVHLW
jgi:hypothetical protein